MNLIENNERELTEQLFMVMNEPLEENTIGHEEDLCRRLDGVLHCYMVRYHSRILNLFRQDPLKVDSC